MFAGRCLSSNTTPLLFINVRGNNKKIVKKLALLKVVKLLMSWKVGKKNKRIFNLQN